MDNLYDPELRLRLMSVAGETLNKITVSREAALFGVYSSAIVSILEGTSPTEVMKTCGYEAADYVRDVTGGFIPVSPADKIREFCAWLSGNFEDYCECQVLIQEYSDAESDQ